MSKILIDEATVKLVLRSLRELVPDDSDHAPALQGQRMRQKKAIDAAREALAEQPAQQEPVAWVEGEEIYWNNAPDLNDWIRQNGQPLYTSPPAQRTWVGLTDEEIVVTVREAARASAIKRDGSTSERIARAIEAKLRSKNEDRN